jgi:hypothetical protein
MTKVYLKVVRPPNEPMYLEARWAVYRNGITGDCFRELRAGESMGKTPWEVLIKAAEEDGDITLPDPNT